VPGELHEHRLAYRLPHVGVQSVPEIVAPEVFYPHPTAKALGMDFIPLMPQRYDLVVPESTSKDQRFHAPRSYPLPRVQGGHHRPGRL
jgi:hypothetical protein